MKKTLTTILLATVLLFGATFANAGIIIAGAAAPEASDSSEPCTETDSDGIIIAGYTGIIIAGFTGIIIAGIQETADDTSTQTCGIIIAG